MSVLEGAILLGEETTYGTPATPTRGYEGKADSWKRQTEYQESQGFRPGMHTLRSDRRRPMHKGGEGEIELDLLTSGAGLLLASVFTTVTSKPLVPEEGKDPVATEFTFATDVRESPKALTVQVLRPRASGGTVAFTHTGVVAKEFTLSQEVDQNLTFKAGFDFQDVLLTQPAGTPAYPAEAVPFAWSECQIALTGVTTTEFAPSKFELNGDLGLKTDRYRLANGGRKTRPFRSQVPAYEGSLAVDFEDVALYEAYIKGSLLGLTATWIGALIAPGIHHLVKVELPTIQFSGESPEMSLDDLTQQPLPFKVLDAGDGTPAVRLTYVTTDTAP
ncbi:hypothetical protein GCM10012275_56330 [Longimycelium tulufanense]|uniref:Uncharacterized protein n=1 Tax=Longimycelium tulufanense TaxID=907463 RepID=A0A8J3FY19_9PSEU|nr:phage tail tube protein [Longimycelium tulufanense]GGM78444.1 hypothetical protein GCM10012275_56330 [Longimycelium tulufanense]